MKVEVFIFYFFKNRTMFCGKSNKFCSFLHKRCCKTDSHDWEQITPQTWPSAYYSHQSCYAAVCWWVRRQLTRLEVCLMYAELPLGYWITKLSFLRLQWSTAFQACLLNPWTWRKDGRGRNGSMRANEIYRLFFFLDHSPSSHGLS